MKIQLFLGLTLIALALGGKLYLIKSFMLNVSVFAINVSEKHSPLGSQNIFPEECLQRITQPSKILCLQWPSLRYHYCLFSWLGNEETSNVKGLIVENEQDETSSMLELKHDGEGKDPGCKKHENLNWCDIRQDFLTFHLT